MMKSIKSNNRFIIINSAWSHNSDGQTYTVRPRDLHPDSEKSSVSSFETEYKAEIEQEKKKEKEAHINDFMEKTEINEINRLYSV